MYNTFLCIDWSISCISHLVLQLYYTSSEDTPHARIYDRLIEMCTPVRITGENFRKAKAQAKMERLKMLLNRKESL